MVKNACQAAGVAGLLLLAAPAAHGTVLPGFSDSLVVAVGAPTAMAFTPDGRLLITTQGGTLRVWTGALPLLTALTIPGGSICTSSEQGLLGVAVDPDFATNNFIYLFYTFESPACFNRVSRFTLPPSNIIAAASELVLVDNMPSPAGNHNAGDVQFGRDGLLYISIGDGGCDWAGDSGCAGANDAARDQHVLTGKILRIAKDGSIPATNPFQGAGTARCNVTGMTTPGNRCQETFAWGFRNPFRMAFDPNDAGTRFFVNDVGQSAWEEVDLIQSGADYGWNCREGAHTNSTSGPCSPTPVGMVDPAYEYRHDLQIPGTTSTPNCNAITGGAFVPNGLWPGFDGRYIFSDFVCGWMVQLTPGFAASDFATNLGNGSAVALLFGPFDSTQALYYTTFAGGGQIRRISRNTFHPGPTEYHTLVPCRALDTRNPNGPQGGPALSAGAPRHVDLTDICGIPATATAIAANVTVVAPTVGGAIQAYPDSEAGTNTAILGVRPGVTRSGSAVITVDNNNGLVLAFLAPPGSTQVVLDVLGYFAP